MSPILIATLAGLVTAFCWGTSDWLSAKSAQKLTSLEINFTLQVVGTALIALLWLVSDVHMPSGAQLLRIGVGGALVDLGYLIFVQALKSGSIGIVAPLGNSYPLVTVALSVIFLTTTFSLAQFAAMVVIVLGATLLAYEKNHMQVPLKELHRQTILSLAAAVTWGVGFFVLSPLSTQISWQALSIAIEIFLLIYSCILLVAANGSKTLSATRRALKSRVALATGVFGTFGGAALYFGGQRAHSLIIPTVISAGGPLIASFWGAVFDKEKLGTLKRAGAFLVVAGIIVLNLP